MDDTSDREKIIDCMFDPVTSSILAELEDGEKECSFLAKKFSISESDVIEGFAYLVKQGFVFEKNDDGKLMFSANAEKLTQIVENSTTFNATIEGLEKMDSYLN